MRLEAPLIAGLALELSAVVLVLLTGDLVAAGVSAVCGGVLMLVVAWRRAKRRDSSPTPRI